MKGKLYFLLHIIIISFSACEVTTVKNVDLKKIVDSLIIAERKNVKSDSTTFNLCTSIPLKWDSLVVVSGYNTPESLKGFKFENQHVLRQFLDRVPEHAVMLLYIKSNRIVGYSDLPNSPLNFSLISRHRHLGYAILYEKECVVVVRKYSYQGTELLKFDPALIDLN